MCASRPSHEIIVQRMQGLGRFIHAARGLAVDEKTVESLPAEKWKILECKRLRLLEKMVVEEGYPDLTFPQNIAAGLSVVGHSPSSSGILPSEIEPATLALSEREEHSAMGRSSVPFSTVSPLPMSCRPRP